MRDKICIGVLILGIILLMVNFEEDSRQKKELRANLSAAQFEATLLQDTIDQKEKDLQEEMRLNTELTVELEEANQVIEDLKGSEYKLVYLGKFRLTHYCDERYNHLCGGNGVTASGTQTSVGRTVAVDPKKIPYGTKMYIEGYGWRTAEDCGSAVKNNQIDILVNTHEQALSLGTKTGGVWILVKNS